MANTNIKLTRGIHVLHLFYRIDRVRWAGLAEGESKLALARLQRLMEANSAPSHPRLVSYVNVGGKADLVFMIYAAEVGDIELKTELARNYQGGNFVPAEFSGREEWLA